MSKSLNLKNFEAQSDEKTFSTELYPDPAMKVEIKPKTAKYSQVKSRYLSRENSSSLQADMSKYLRKSTSNLDYTQNKETSPSDNLNNLLDLSPEEKKQLESENESDDEPEKSNTQLVKMVFNVKTQGQIKQIKIFELENPI